MIVLRVYLLLLFSCVCSRFLFCFLFQTVKPHKKVTITDSKGPTNLLYFRRISVIMLSLIKKSKVNELKGPKFYIRYKRNFVALGSVIAACNCTCLLYFLPFFLRFFSLSLFSRVHATLYVTVGPSIGLSVCNHFLFLGV